MVNVDSPLWQWHLDGSRLIYLCFIVICTGDKNGCLFYTQSNTFLDFSWGAKSLFGT